MNTLTIFANCKGNAFLGIEGWYKYLPGSCADLDFDRYGVGSIWLIVAGVTDALLRIAAIVAVFFFIFGAFKMIVSQGSPEQVKNARNTMTNSIIGLVICILAASIISFIMGTVFPI